MAAAASMSMVPKTSSPPPPQSVEVQAKNCKCEACQIYKKEKGSEAEKKFTLLAYKYDYEFPSIPCPDSSRLIDINTVANIFEELEKQKGQSKGKLENCNQIIMFLTYREFNVGRASLVPLNSVIDIFDYLHGEDLQKISFPPDLAKHFLQRICQLFTYAWHCFASGFSGAETFARKLRNFLSYLVTVPVFMEQVRTVFTTEELWPRIGPRHALEYMADMSLVCIDTLALFCNLTRVEGIPDYIFQKSELIQTVKDKFVHWSRAVSKAQEMGGMVLLFFINMGSVKEFAQYLVEGHAGYFLKSVVYEAMMNTHPASITEASLWPLLKNLALTDSGRKVIMENIDILLGPILLPIAGPEKVDDEEQSKLPSEVQYLPKTKKRTENKTVRNCILDILYCLCRFRADRRKLRDKNVYIILKHYHLVEKDSDLIEKIESLVNILIRHEVEEIPVDDLLEGLSLDEGSKEDGTEEDDLKADPSRESMP